MLRLCWSESGAPQTLPPSPELLVLLLGEVQVLKVLEVVMMEVEVVVCVSSVASHLVEGQPRETPEPRADQVSPLVDLAREV